MHEEMTPHRAEAQNRLSTLGKRFFGLIEFDEDEELVYEIRKHPFGLLLVELGGFLVVALLTGIPMGIAFNLDFFLGGSNNSMLLQTILVLAGALLGLLALGATFISAMIYRNNVIYITTEKIAQVLYLSLFNRKVSQLSIGDVQDVTVTQNGVFPRLFKYGTLVVETAGEQQNYTFNYVPNPYESGRAIVKAHEENLRKYGN